MPISPDEITAGLGLDPGEALYASASTRVVRVGAYLAAGSVVFKEYLGPHAARRLRNEKKLLKRLAGIEGVAQLAEQSESPGVLALRDRGGISLAQMLQVGTVDTSMAVSLACQLARTLAEVHRAGIIHRDINPANILVSAGHQAELIDFDLAVLAEQHLAVEPDEQIVGTLSYIAPEQTGRTGHAVDQRADLYALGATLYEMAAGRVPFEQADALQLIRDHLVREPVAPCQIDPRVPRGLSDIIVRLLAKAPEKRYQSAQGLLHDLQRLYAEREQGSDGVFELGERDFPARLAAPAQPVGRDAELAQLVEALGAAMHTPRRTVLIGGPAGVGKSALINELRPIVENAGGWFISGKFDQYQRDGTTSGALTQTLRALGRLLLTQSVDKVAIQRERILHRLASNAGLITRASPEFALLLGVQSDVPEVDPRQAELQFQQAMLDLLIAIASPECPLVAVVDDLQWAGAFSLRLLERVMVEPQLRGLLLVGTYRADEVDAGHILAPMLQRWRELSPPVSQIALANLSVEGLGELTGRMLRLAPGPSRELAQALNVLTGGNPFDTIEMINALRGDGVLSLGESGWQWDDVKVRRFIGRGDVVDLLAARINRLPAASLELLEFMSCLGSTVECSLLCAAAGLGDNELQARLRAPLEDGLLVAVQIGGQDSVGFRHDRVQQAMQGAMDDSQRGRRQLAMARRLAGDRAFRAEAAQQYLMSVGLLDQPEEQRRAAHLFHGLAQVLASTASWMLAERYLCATDMLLAAIDDPVDAGLRRTIDVARHCALYSLGRMAEADPLYERIQARTQDPLDLVAPTCLQIRSLDMHGRTGEALALGVRLLTQLGLHVPPDFSDPHREQRIDALGEWVWQEGKLDHSKRARSQDPRMLGICKLLARIARSAYHGQNSQATAWVLLETHRLWVEHGPCEDLMGCVGNLGVLIVQRQDYRTAYEVSRHVIAVGEALGFDVRTAATRFMFSWGTCPWFEPLESALDHATRAFDVFQARGDDASFGCYFNIPKLVLLLEIAPSLDNCDPEIEAGLALCLRTGNMHAAALHRCEQQLLRALRGQTCAMGSLDDDQFDSEAFMAKLGHLPHIRSALVHCCGFLSLIHGDAAGLARNEGKSVYGLYRLVHNQLFAALARAWQLQPGGSATSGSAPLLAELDACRAWFASRATEQPYNFLHLLRLVEAEQAWAVGDMWKAAAAYDAAVLEAATRHRPWHRGLITERAGLFNLAQGLVGAGRDLLAKARDCYQAWGATAKVDQMQRTHAFLRAPARSLMPQLVSSHGHPGDSSPNFSSDVLDLVGVLRASQALSSETSREQLTARVTEVLASLSGATKVLVLSSTERQWWLHSPTPAEPSVPVEQAAERGLLPLSAFAYAARTGDTLVVSDAISDVRFARDPYFARVAVCSLLVVPIAGQGDARAMLLLENRLGSDAFNAQRLDAVMLIAGQLAVSLANAQLYESLEQRVQAHTRELQETQVQLVTTARRAGMAEIANNVLHNVGNVLNSINVSARVLRGTIANSRIDGLSRAVALINEHANDLPKFIDTDPRGKMLWPYLNELVLAFRADQQGALGDLERLTRGVEHITYVVSTQQAHAGPLACWKWRGRRN